MGEEVERYELRVLAAGALLRRIETGSAQWTYEAAAFDADGGGALTIEVRQIGSFALGRPARIMLPG